nr:uncharacterized protein At3g17950-like isoform X1 [Ipomoea trifida]
MAAGQENGWPLGLRHPHNLRIRRFNGSIVSFDTTASPTSISGFSSDLDTQSTGSFFRDNSITLGSLMGISNLVELSRRSSTRRTRQPLRSESSVVKSKKTCLFSLCYRLNISGDEVDMKTAMAPSLGYLLEVERRASARFYQPNHQFSADSSSSHLSLSYLCGYFCH